MPNINEKTGVPIGWIFGLFGVGGTVAMVAAGLLVWGVRLEAKTEQKVDKVDYVTDIAQVKADLRAIKLKLNIKE